MKKLFNLKEWLTVDQAARFLTALFQEDVTEADVLRLALDGHLRLSVNFVNHATARKMRVVPIEEARFVIIDHDSSERFEFRGREVEFPTRIDYLTDEIKKGAADGSLGLHPMGDRLNEREVLEYEDGISDLTGVWDLLMIGGEALDVEHMYQMRTGGPEVTLTEMGGTFVRSRKGDIFKILESYEDNEYTTGSRANLDRLKRYITDNDIDAERGKQLLEQYKEDRKEFLSDRDSKPEEDRYFPAGGLPRDSVLVVRTSALQEFQANLSKTDAQKSKPLSDRAETTYLNIIGSLLDLILSDSSLGTPRSVFRNQTAIINAMLEHFPNTPGISKKTLEGKFSAAKQSLKAH